jgi:hypothetical protein
MNQKKGKDGKRRSRWAVIRNTAQQLKDTTIKTFFDWVPPGQAGKWSVTDKTFYLKFGDVEAEILFRPLDTPEDVHRVLSLELTGAWINECREIPEELVNALQGRLRRYPSQDNGGFSWSGLIADTNPPDEDSWWCDRMTENKPENWGVFFQPSGVSPEAENIEHLAENYYEDLMIGKSEDWINVYIHGRFGRSVAGKPVYLKTFNESIHVAKQYLKAIPEELVFIGMDFGLTPAAAICQFDGMGRLCILEEVPRFDMGLERFMDHHLLPILRRKYSKCPIKIIGDPSGGNRNQVNEANCIRTLKRKYRMDAEPASVNLLEPRISAVEHFLMRLIDGVGGLLIDPRCKMIIQGFRSRYKYRKLRDGTVSVEPEKNDWSHIHDAIQYACLYAKGSYSRDKARKNMREQPFAESRRATYRPQVW